MIFQNAIAGAKNQVFMNHYRCDVACFSTAAAGIQLIDRNDELCILYEKCNIQENILKNGQVCGDAFSTLWQTRMSHRTLLCLRLCRICVGLLCVMHFVHLIARHLCSAVVLSDCVMFYSVALLCVCVALCVVTAMPQTTHDPHKTIPRLQNLISVVSGRPLLEIVGCGPAGGAQ